MTVSRKISYCPDCGAVQARGRSVPDMRRFFSVLRKAYENWPELCEFQPSDEENMRGYLLVKAGHYETEFVHYPDEASESIRKLFRVAIEGTFAALSRRRSYSEIRVTAGGVEILVPKSIAFHALTQKEWGPIRESVEAVVEQVIGVPAEELLRARAA